MSLFQVFSSSLIWVGERFLSDYVSRNKAPSDPKLVQELWKHYPLVIVALRLLLSFFGLFSGAVRPSLTLLGHRALFGGSVQLQVAHLGCPASIHAIADSC